MNDGPRPRGGRVWEGIRVGFSFPFLGGAGSLFFNPICKLLKFKPLFPTFWPAKN